MIPRRTPRHERVSNPDRNPGGSKTHPEQIFEISRQREVQLSRMLVAYIGTGLAFMLLPGTFLGVWNLIKISAHTGPGSISPAWIQAHGHAQILGWVGSFILGIGFYSIPKLRRADPFAMSAAWLCFGLWTGGVAMRWLANVYLWQWRALLPVSAAMEIAAFFIFLHSVSGHRPASLQPAARTKFEAWTLVVMLGTFGFLISLILNLAGVLWVATSGSSPAFPHAFDQRFLVLITWGFLVPTVWGFSSRWLPTFLGLKKSDWRLLLGTAAVNTTAVAIALAGKFLVSTLLLLAGTLLVSVALGVFERSQQNAKLNGVHSSFPVFIRIAYGWLLVAASLGIWAVTSGDPSGGIGGASRHALTVGFVSTMVFAIGQRILPAFSGMRLLFSTRLMFAALALLTVGCVLRVSSEVLAYPGFASWAWHLLPLSAITELTAVFLFALNLSFTFLQRPAPQLRGVILSGPVVRTTVLAEAKPAIEPNQL